ncbi:MAG TPA: hypothetical protein VK864_01540 [Longimicrobiales bacterium]|nr:hypothetical protein [Longimicrobiales bacterium]
MTPLLSRRAWLGALAGGAALGCSPRIGDALQGDGAARLTARPGSPSSPVTPGQHPLHIAAGRDGFLRIPLSYDPGTPAPLVVMLHGAGGSAAGVSVLPATTDAHGILLLVPESRGPTWDAIRGGYGPDITFLDRALQQTFARCNVRADRIGIWGFSDGATYALSVGLANGDLFSHIAAFSPGFVVEAKRVGRPRIFISHGRSDRILPIARTSRLIVPALERAGYDVEYLEFDGGHAVTDPARAAAVQTLLG